MRFNTKVIEDYKDYITTNYNGIEEEYDKLKADRLIFQELIIGFKGKVYDNPILDEVILCVADKFRKYDIAKVKKFKNNIVCGSNYKQFINYNYCSKDEAIVLRTYYVTFVNTLLKEVDLKAKMFELLQYELPDETIKKLTNGYFAEVSKLLLIEPNSRFNLNARMSISIKGKSRSKVKYGDKAKPAPLDWGKSILSLKAIAKKYDTELVAKFEAKQIRQKEFIAKAKTYGYNKDTNPDGEKWLERIDQDMTFWVLLNKSIMCTTNESMYAIVPSSCRHVGGVSLNKYINEHLGTKEAILNDNALGFADKIRALAKIDFTYCLKTFDNDL